MTPYLRTWPAAARVIVGALLLVGFAIAAVQELAARFAP